jgi:outer membrane protein OmpA-like peptidoglycan-associated protein
VRSTIAACLVLLTSASAGAQPITPPPVASPPLPAESVRPVDKPAEKAGEKAGDKPADTIAQKSPEKPAEKPADPPAPPPPSVQVPADVAPAPPPVAPPPVAPPPLTAIAPRADVPVVVADRTEVPEGVYARRRLVLPSQLGPVGLYRLSAADAGDIGQVRIGLHAEYASADDFLIKGSRNRRLAGTLSVGGTPLRYLEVFGAILASANRNERCATSEPGCTPEMDRADPATIRAFGDLVFGGKVAAPVLPGLRLGGESGVRLFAANDGLSLDGDSTSFWATGLGSVDVRELAGLPLLVHLNLGYYADNSENLQDFSRFRPGMLPSRLVTSFAYGMGSSRLRTGLGVGAPLLANAQTMGGIALEPFAEYHAELVTAEADPAYAAFMPPECEMPGRECIDNRDQQWVSFGLRAQLAGGFSMSAGLDITLRSTGFPYGPALLPWNFLIGVAQAFDFSGPPKTVTRTVTLQRTVEKAPAPREGFVTGKVMNASATEPIPGAVVSVIGQNRARVATDVDGSFATKGLPAGPVKLEVSAPNFEAQVIEARVIVGQTTEIQASLRPTLAPPRLEGSVLDASKRPLAAARIRIVGPTSAELATDVAGRFSAELAPGAYVATIDAPGQVPQEQRFELKPGLVFPLEVSLVRERGSAPAVSDTPETTPAAAPPAAVAYRDGKLVLRRPLTFRIVDDTPSAELVASSRATLEALARLLAINAEINKLRIEAHWDSAVGREEADALTKKQAEAIAAFLVEKGVAPERLEAVGMGASNPRVPNLSPAVRAKNRRVEITVVN